MSAPVEEALALLTRLRSSLTTQQATKSGKQQPDVAVGLQDLLALLSNYNCDGTVVLAALKLLEESLSSLTQASTILRLEGGLKVLPRLFRSCAADGSVLAACARVLCRCTATSPVNQQTLAKERGLGAALLTALSAHCRDTATTPPLLELIVILSRSSRGAQSLGGEAMVLVARDILLTYMGNWVVLGLVIKALKLQAKHDSVAACLMRVSNGEVSRMLMAMMRLLARLTGQRKLIKRTSRALWLLHRSALPPLPPLEPLVPLPPRDAPHLALAAATEAMDGGRLMELVPEEFVTELQAAYLDATRQQGGSNNEAISSQLEAAPSVSGAPISGDGPILPLAAGVGFCVPGRFAHMARQACPTALRPPSAQELSQAAGAAAAAGGGQTQEPFHNCRGDTLEIDMMMHDLRRLAHPEAVHARMVYDSTWEAATETPGASQHTPVPPVPTLTFESRFESGNLRAAVQVYDNEYDLFLASDLNDRSEGGNLCQWFYFSVGGVQPGVPYKFNLVNFRKKQSLFSSGKQPLVCLAQPNNNTPATVAGAGAAAGGVGVGPGVQQGVTQQETGETASLPLQAVSEQGDALVSSLAANGWVRAGGCVSYYPSPYRGRRTALPAAAAAAAAADASSRRPASKKAPVRRAAAPRPTAAGQLPPAPQTAAPASQREPAGSCAKDLPLPPAPGPGDGPPPSTGPGLYCATFTLVFQQPGVYYLASCYPYTYTDLQEHLDQVASRLTNTISHNSASRTSPVTVSTIEQQLAPDPLKHQPDQPQPQQPPSRGNQPPSQQPPSQQPPSQQPPSQHQQQPASRASSASPSAGVMPPSSLPPAGLFPHPAPALLSSVLVRSVLCYTAAGHACELLTVTDYSSPPEVITAREVVFMTARVHPGETCASWIMQGVIDFLVSDDPAACMLRAHFIFKLVPMLNPDGVVNGSYRCSLAGMDLNRTWEKPLKTVQPTVYHSKRLMQAVAAGGAGRLALYIDVHGHSNKEDVFFYGCEPNLSGYGPPAAPPPPPLPQQPRSLPAPATPASPPGRLGSGSNSNMGTGESEVPSTGGVSARTAARLRVRMLPFIMSRVNDAWSLSKCNFRIRKAKLGAARVVVHRELGCAGAYTLEASLGGRGSNATHFNAADYLNMGRELCRGIAELAEVDDGALLEEMSNHVGLAQYVGTFTV